MIIGWLALTTDAHQSAAGSRNVVLEWNEIATDAYDHAPDIPASWRGIPIAQVAVFEAVNAIDGRYEPYPSPQGPLMAPAGSSADAAAVAAAYQVLRSVYPKETWIDGRQSDSLKNIPDGTAKNDGIAVGKAAAARVLALRKDDGWYRNVSSQSAEGSRSLASDTARLRGAVRDAIRISQALDDDKRIAVSTGSAAGFPSTALNTLRN